MIALRRPVTPDPAVRLRALADLIEIRDARRYERIRRMVEERRAAA